MIEWFGFAQMAVAGIAAILCFAVAFIGRAPNDLTMGATVLVTVLLIAQVVISIIAPFTGNPPRGDGLEFGLYLFVAVLMPIIAGVWALVDRSKWANMVLGVVHIALVVMVYRMLDIWGTPAFA